MSWDEAEALLVTASEFGESQTRVGLWQGLLDYVARFFDLEQQHVARLDGGHLVERLWLGGSFVSTKLDPDNVDLSVLLDRDVASRIVGQPGVKWLARAFNRDLMKSEFGVTPLPINYRRVVSPFRQNELTIKQREYYEERGTWDDWWQRCRTDEVDRAPSWESAVAARGYVEVVL